MDRQTSRNLILNIALTVAFLVSLKPFVTGLALHEWLGLAIGAGILAHALLHRRWIAGITRRLAQRLPARTRLHYALDAALLFAFAYLIGSGLWISEAVLPLLGLRSASSLGVAAAHRLSAYVTLGLLAAKLALHWRWFARAMAPRQRAHAPTPARPFLVSRRALLLGGGAALALAVLGWPRNDDAAAAPPASGDLAEGEEPAGAAESAMPATSAPLATATVAPAMSEQKAASPDPTPTAEQGLSPLATATLAPTLAPTAQPVARTRCPYGLVNDPYPGRCRRYVDRNGSGYCDLSETA